MFRSDTLRTHGTPIDKEAVARYLDALCDAYLLYKVQRYEIKGNVADWMLQNS